MGRFAVLGLLVCLPTLIITPSVSAQDAASWYDEGLSLEQSGEYLTAFNRFLRAEGEARREGNLSLAAESRLHASDCQRALGNTLEFRRFAEDVLRSYPDESAACAGAIIRIGEDTWRTGNASTARKILSRVKVQYPDDTDAIGEAGVLLGNIDLSQGNPEAALAEAEGVLASANGTESWYPSAQNLADRAKVAIAERQVKDPETRAQGIAALEAVLADTGTSSAPRAWANYHLSLAKYWIRDYAGSAVAAEAALKTQAAAEDPGLGAWASLQLAIARIAQGDVDGAYDAVITCHRDHGDFPDGGFQDQLGQRFDEIVEAKKAAGGLAPEPADPDPVLTEEAKVQAEAAFALVYTGDATGAISLLQTVIADYANQPGAVGWARYRLAEAYYQNRDYGNTIATAETLLADYSPTEYSLLCGWADLMLAAGRLANGEPEAALAVLEGSQRTYALVEDEGYRNALGSRLHEARTAARSAVPDPRAEKLAIVNNRWMLRESRRKALREYAGMCEKEGNTLALIRASVRLRQQFGDDPTVMNEANETLDRLLGPGNVPDQVEILRQARDAADNVIEKEIVQEEIAYRYLAGGYIDEATAACEEALNLYGREARRSFRLAVTQGEAYLRAWKRLPARRAFLRAVPRPFVHSEPADQVARKLGYIDKACWGTAGALRFYDSLDVPAGDAERDAWRILARLGDAEDLNQVVADAETRLLAASTDEERFPLYRSLVWAQLDNMDYAAVESTIAEMRSRYADDRKVDEALMEIVLHHLGPRGEVVCQNIINNSTSEFMRQAATFELGWCKRFEKDLDGALFWFQQTGSMPAVPGEVVCYPWKGHMEAAVILRAKGGGSLPYAGAHLQEALLAAQEFCPDKVEETYLRLGEIREGMGDYSGATELYNLAVESAAGEDGRYFRADALIALGRVKMKQGDTVGAESGLLTAKEKAPHRRLEEKVGRLLERVESAY